MKRVDWPVVIGLLLGLVIAFVVPVGAAVSPGGYGGEFNERVILDASQVQSPSDVAAEDLACEAWLQQATPDPMPWEPGIDYGECAQWLTEGGAP
jgi:hypothetical protein